MGEDCCGDRDDCPSDLSDPGGETDEARGEDVVHLDEILSCLSDSDRRAVLYHLHDGEVTDVESLAAHLVAKERDLPPEDVPEDDRERMAATLIHKHLPKLAEANIVEFDHRSQTVRYSNPPRLMDRVLGLLARLESRDKR